MNRVVSRAAQITFDVDFDGVPFVLAGPRLRASAGISWTARVPRVLRTLRQFIELIERDTGATQIHLHRPQHGLRSAAARAALNVY